LDGAVSFDPTADYQAASFRGAVFHVREGSSEIGRRLVRHEYPGKDLPYNEDMGRRARAFTLEAYVIGPEYKQQRDALLAACEQVGPGKLVHPWLGTMDVQCLRCSIKQSANAAGEVVLSLSFEEAGERNYPSEEPDYSYQAAGQAATVRTTAGSALSEVYSTLGPAWLATAAAGDVKGAFKLLTEVVRGMPGPLDNKAVGEFLSKVEEIAATVEDAATNPESLAGVLTDAIKGLGGLAGDEDSSTALDAALDLADFGAPNQDGTGLIGGLDILPIDPPTATRQLQADNRAAVVQTVKSLALAEAVEAAMVMDFTAYQDAKASRDALLGKLDTSIMEAGDNGADDLCRSLTDLSRTLLDAFRAKAAALPHLVNMAPSTLPMPSVVVAYDLYKDLSRESEIVKRNGITHPGLPKPGEPLLVLDA
jgi:prophage DNA circulation protein